MLSGGESMFWNPLQESRYRLSRSKFVFLPHSVLLQTFKSPPHPGTRGAMLLDVGPTFFTSQQSGGVNIILYNAYITHIIR